MYARLTTYRTKDRSKQSAAGAGEFVRLLADQEGCRGAWQLGEEGNDTETTYFSLWETKAQAEAAGENAREGMMQLFERSGTELTAPPAVRILSVEEASQAR